MPGSLTPLPDRRKVTEPLSGAEGEAVAEVAELFPFSRPDGGRSPAAPHAPDEALESPEILVINALLESGTFDPATYGLNDEMVMKAYAKAWAFCTEHQQQVGRAPARDLFARSFPHIEIVSNVDPFWAADRLRTAAWERELRRNLQGAIGAINEGEWSLAQEIVAKAAKPQSHARPKGMSARDVASVDDGAFKIAMPVPYHSLMRETQGLGLGELWYLAARLGQGKSWYLPLFAACAAEYGIETAVLTAEMPKRQWINRIHKIAAPDKKTRKELHDGDVKVRQAAMERMPAWLDNIEVLDSSDIEMGVRSVRVLSHERKLIVGDHVGLFRDAKGSRSIEDWRNAASISNDLKEIALASQIGLLFGVQVNREGESGGHKPPKVSQLAQSDALGQDADVAIVMRRMGEGAMMLETGKNRSGPNVRWYSMFDPKNGDFSEIDKDKALNIQINDAERLGDA